MTQGLRITVAGAGALGLTTALELARAGARVTVCDPALGGANASSVAAGMLAPVFEALLDDQAAAHLDLLLAARDLWPGLAAISGVGLDRSGAIAAGSETWLQPIRAGFERLGLRATELGAATLADLAPGLAPTTGLLTREDWRLEPGPAMAALIAAGRDAGVEFRAERAESVGEADLLVAATGPGSGLAPELARLSPIKGHILRAALADTGRVTVRGEGAYAVPAAGGLSVGGTMEPGLADLAVDQDKAEALRAAGARLYPVLSAAPVQVLTGVRAATPDGLPLVGPSSEPKVLVAAGARRNGWLLAPLVARIITAYATGADPGPFAARLAAGRFG